MNNPRISEIKKEQKESLLLREISGLLLKASLDDPKLAGLSVLRVKLSPDKGTCFVFIYAQNGIEEFKEKLESLKLYKPSLRKAVSRAIKGRYTPDIKFEFDSQFEKQSKMEEIFEQLKKDGQL